MTTHECGAVVPEGAFLCPGCAMPVVDAGIVPAAVLAAGPAAARPEPAPRPSTSATCPQCNVPVPDRATTCSFCGDPVGSTPVSAQLTLRMPDGSRIVLAAGTPVVLGRESPDPTVRASLAASTVSRQHASVELHAEALVVTDLDSLNGTFVDGRQVSGSARLPLGPTTIGLGRSVQIHVDEGRRR